MREGSVPSGSVNIGPGGACAGVSLACASKPSRLSIMVSAFMAICSSFDSAIMARRRARRCIGNSRRSTWRYSRSVARASSGMATSDAGIGSANAEPAIGVSLSMRSASRCAARRASRRAAVLADRAARAFSRCERLSLC